MVYGTIGVMVDHGECGKFMDFLQETIEQGDAAKAPGKAKEAQELLAALRAVLGA